MGLVTIATFRTIPEAYVAKAVLDEAGILAFVADDQVASWLVGIPSLFGGVKLQVSEWDAERAVARLDRGKAAESAPAESDEEVGE